MSDLVFNIRSTTPGKTMDEAETCELTLSGHAPTVIRIYDLIAMVFEADDNVVVRDLDDDLDAHSGGGVMH